MLQWMGGARRKMKATQDSKLKRQREFFDRRKEKQRKKELGEEPGNVHTLADYIRQNLHGGESLDILGLRSLNPTPADVNTAANSDASLPDPATAVMRPNSRDAGGVTPALSNASASSVGALKQDTQDTSSQQPEYKTKSCGIIQELEQEIMPCVPRQTGVPAAAEQENQNLINLNTEIPLPGKGRNPIHVGNLQTKKVASTPRLKLLDIISDDSKGENGSKKRLPSETYDVFLQYGNDAIGKTTVDQDVLHPQQMSATSDSVADWSGTKYLLNSSQQLKDSYDSHPKTLVTGTSGLLTRFLSTQKLKSFKGPSSHQRDCQPKIHSLTKDQLLPTESVLNSFRSHNLDFSKSFYDMEDFHVVEPQNFDISDPFVTNTNHQMNQEPQECGFADPFFYTSTNQVEEHQEYGYLNPGFNNDHHQVMRKYPFEPALNFDRSAFKVDTDFFHQKEGLDGPANYPVTWNNGISSAFPNFSREFPALDHHFCPVQVPRFGRSQNIYSSQFGGYDKIPDMIEDFYPNVDKRRDKRGISAAEFDEFRLPLYGFDVKRQHTKPGFPSLDDFSARRIWTNQSHFENDVLYLNDDGRNEYASSEQWKCKPSTTWDVPRHQENIDSDHSGRNLDQSQNHDDSNSWSQSVDGAAADHFTDCLASDLDTTQGNVLSSETKAIIAPQTLQDLQLRFLPQIKNGNEDFVIVCFRDNEDCPTVDANANHLPMQPTSTPLQVLGASESSSGMEHDNDVLSSETPFWRISQSNDGSRLYETAITAEEATTTTHNNLISAREVSASVRTLTSSHLSQMDIPLLLNSGSSLEKGTEVMSWQVKGPQSEAYSGLQSPYSRSSSRFLAKGGNTIEDSLERQSSSYDRTDQCFSSNVQYDHASRHETTDNIEEKSVEVCTTLKEPIEEDVRGMNTMKVEGMVQKRLWTEDGIAHDPGCRASFSSQEECSPACQLNTVQAIVCKLQRPVISCGSKKGKFPEQGIKNVDTVLLKLRRPTRHSIHGFLHQDAEAHRTNVQKDLKQTSDMHPKSNLESEIKTIPECQIRLLTHNNTSGSRGSLPLPNASKPTSPSSNNGEDQRGQSDISTHQNKEARLSLDDIDTIASTDHQVSKQRENHSEAFLLPSIIRIKGLADSAVSPAGDAKQHSTPVLQRKPASEAPDEELPFHRDSDPPARRTGVSPALTSSRSVGELETPFNTPQASEMQKSIKASQEREGLPNNRLPVTGKNIQQGREPTTSPDTAYVKMLESYVVQLKLENKILKLLTG